MRTLLPVLLSATVLLAGCAPAISSRPCPKITEFPAEVQRQAADEIKGRPAISRMMDAMAGDRAFNRAVCQLTSTAGFVGSGSPSGREGGPFASARFGI